MVSLNYIFIGLRSFIEEANADKAIKALTAALAPQARALRDGRLQVRSCVQRCIDAYPGSAQLTHKLDDCLHHAVSMF